MKLLLIVLLPVFTFGQVTLGQNSKKLDELLIKSKSIQQHGVQGFIFKTKTQPKLSIVIEDTTKVRSIRLDTISKKSIEITGEKSIETAPIVTSAPVPKPKPKLIMGQYVPYLQYVTDVEKRDQQISDLNSQMTKLTTIVENNVEHASTMSKIFDMLTKICESIGALIAVISALAAFLKFKKKKNT
jgi:hypothetical protein